MGSRTKRWVVDGLYDDVGGVGGGGSGYNEMMNEGEEAWMMWISIDLK